MRLLYKRQANAGCPPGGNGRSGPHPAWGNCDGVGIGDLVDVNATKECRLLSEVVHGLGRYGRSDIALNLRRRLVPMSSE